MQVWWMLERRSLCESHSSCCVSRKFVEDDAGRHGSKAVLGAQGNIATPPLLQPPPPTALLPLDP